RGGRLQGPAVRVQLLRQQGRRAEVLGDARQGREPAVAGDDEGADRQRADRRRRRARVLRAAAGVAQAAERRTGLRLAGAANGGGRTGAESRLSRACGAVAPRAPGHGRPRKAAASSWKQERREALAAEAAPTRASSFPVGAASAASL